MCTSANCKKQISVLVTDVLCLHSDHSSDHDSVSRIYASLLGTAKESATGIPPASNRVLEQPDGLRALSGSATRRESSRETHSY